MKRIFIILLFVSNLAHAQTAIEYYSMGHEAWKDKQLEKAVEYFGKASELWFKEGKKDLYAAALYWLGYTYELLGNYNSSLDAYKNALFVVEQSGDKEGIASYQNKIAEVYMAWGKYDLAIEYLNRSIEISKDGNRLDLAAICMLNVGDIYRAWGKFKQAIENYNRALGIFTEQKRKNNVVKALNKIAEVNQYLKNYNQALNYLNKALTIEEELGRKEKIASQLINIGRLFKNWGKYELALENYNKALKLAQELERETDIAVYSHYLGELYLSWGKFMLSVEHYRSALKHYEKLGIKAAIAQCYNDIGRLYKTWSKYYLSLEYFNKSLEVSKDLQRKTDMAEVLNNIGVVYGSLGNYDLAIDYLERSVAIKEELRLTAPGESKRNYLASELSTYQLLISAAIRANKPLKALTSIEQSKARYLSEKIGEKFNNLNIGNITYEELQAELSNDEAILIYANSNREKLALVVLTKKDIFSMEIEMLEITKKLKQKYEKEMDYTLELGRGISTERKEYENEKNLLNKIITYYRYLLSLKHPTVTEKNQIEEIGKKLYRILIDPLSEKLKGKKNLLIIPDGVLGFLPFETLIDRKGHYIVENYITRYSQSLAVFNFISERRYSNFNNTLIAFGGPVYESEKGVGRAMNQEGSDKTLPGSMGSTVSEKEIVYAITRGQEYIEDVYDRLDLSWGNLPGTLEEVKEIGNMFKDSSIYTGLDVNENMVKKLSAQGELKRYEIIHFSTHGLVVPEYPELSALVFSQMDTSKEDGYLCMPEIAELDIKAEFVNLSACETGLGKIYAGEGVVGLPQSFLIAGAKALSVSLWQVEDDSTKEFMVGMYRKVKEEGLSYPDAIREMKLEFLGEKYKNPFFWAPFVYYGK